MKTLIAARLTTCDETYESIKTGFLHNLLVPCKSFARRDASYYLVQDKLRILACYTLGFLEEFSLVEEDDGHLYLVANSTSLRFEGVSDSFHHVLGVDIERAQSARRTYELVDPLLLAHAYMFPAFVKQEDYDFAYFACHTRPSFDFIVCARSYGYGLEFDADSDTYYLVLAYDALRNVHVGKFG